MVYDLEDRTKNFGLAVIKFCKSIGKDNINSPLVGQLVRSATSIGANYNEANGAASKKDFKSKIYICKKESRETKYWLEIIASSNPIYKEQARVLWKEAQELTLIFSKIILSIDKKKI